MTRERETVVNGVRNTSRVDGKVVGDSRGDGITEMMAKVESNEILNGKESRTDRSANTSSFECSIVRAVGDVSKGWDQFSRAGEIRVLRKQVSKEIKTTILKFGGNMNNWDRWHN